MFIKVFVPNSRGKIELTVEELEELLSDACAKAVKEKCASCNRVYYGGITCLDSNSSTDWSTYKTLCSNESTNNAEIQINGQSVKTNDTNSTNDITLMGTINDLIGEQLK